MVQNALEWLRRPCDSNPFLCFCPVLTACSSMFITRTHCKIPFRLKTASLHAAARAPLVIVTTVTLPSVAHTAARDLQYLARKRTLDRYETSRLRVIRKQQKTAIGNPTAVCVGRVDRTTSCVQQSFWLPASLLEPSLLRPFSERLSWLPVLRRRLWP